MRGALEREELEHPRATLAVRVLLYVGLAVVLGTLAVGVVGYLLVVAAVGGFAVLVGSGTGTFPLIGFAVGGIGIAVVVGVGTAVAVRWADRRVVAADRRPDPVEELTERYVDAELDEIEFERRLEAAFANRRGTDGEIDAVERTGASRDGDSSLSVETNHNPDGTDR